MEERVLMKNPFLKNIFSNAEFLYESPLTISRISFNKKSQVENHVLMIGDAAGMITPLCGNGMSMALHGSKLAFEEINFFLKNKIVGYEKDKDVQRCISTPAGRIPEGLQRHETTKRRIKKIYQR